jgi:hypothetical protein
MCYINQRSVFLGFWLLIAAMSSAAAEKRVALVIGNGGYEHADRLDNPVFDARRMRDTLKTIGFEDTDIVYGENLNKRDLERAIGRFATVARDSDVAIVYYAGHGSTFADIPYLVPIDAQFSNLDEMAYELVPLDSMVGELRRAKGIRIAIVDACRDNTAEQRLKKTSMRGGEISRGLAPPRNPDGLVVAYATQYLSTAADGPPGTNSPFTRVLVQHLPTPGLDVKDLFFEVGRQVVEETHGAQRPEIKISLFDRYSLVGGSAASTPPPALAPPPAPDSALGLAVPPDSNSGRTPAGGQVAALPPATNPDIPRPPRPERVTIAGEWNGTYFYPAGSNQRPVIFKFTFGSNGCSGRSSEPNTFGDKSAPQLFANLRCSVSALTPGQIVTITKQYDGTGGVSHSVVYSGTVSADLRRIDGQWTIGTTTGRFTMQR